MSAQTAGPDIEGVLGRHQIGYERRCYPSYVCLCGWDGAQGDNGSESDGQHDNADAARAHVAAAVRAEVRAWLESNAVERGIVQQANAEDDRHFAAGSSHGLGAGEAVSLTLAALAAQVAPSRVPREGS